MEFRFRATFMTASKQVLLDRNIKIFDGENLNFRNRRSITIDSGEVK